MASYFDQAGEAIGLAVQNRQPSNQHNWGNIIPQQHWGMDAPTWAEMLDEIIATFSGSISPARIRQGETFDGSRSKELYRLQRRLADSVE